MESNQHAADCGPQRPRGPARPARWWTGLLLVALTSAPRSARAECATTADCPSGLECQAGACVGPPALLPVDTVFLADGGRVRGQVMEEHPKMGVRIRLADGTVRELAAADVDHVEYGDAQPSTPSGPTPSPEPTPAPTPAATVPAEPKRPSGAARAAKAQPTPRATRLRVVAGELGTLRIDGRAIATVGPGGRELRDLAEGRHEVEVEFTAGQSARDAVDLRPGEPVELTLEPPGARYAFRHRDGLRFGFGAGGFYLFRPWSYAEPRPVEEVLGTTTHGGGGYLEGVMSYALSPAIELRLVPRLALGSIPLEWQFRGTVTQGPDWVPYLEDARPQYNALAIVPSALAAVRWNLTSRYSMMLGFRAGIEAFVAEEQVAAGNGNAGQLAYDGTRSPASDVTGHLGPEISLLSLALGARREVEIDCWQGLLIDSMPSFQAGLGVRYLVLPDADDVASAPRDGP